VFVRTLGILRSSRTTIAARAHLRRRCGFARGLGILRSSIHRYLTKPDGTPIEQGEGCQIMPRTSKCSTGGSYLYHNYDPDSWESTEPDASIFDVPSVCTQSTKTCYFP
jgi:hypothetical protein